MHKKITQCLIAVMILVSFVGQVLAFSVSTPCELSMDVHVSSDHAAQDNHDDPESKESDCCDTECCDIDCVCAASACSTSAYLTNNVVSNQVAIATLAICKRHVQQPKSITTSVYRPPIITS